MSAKVSLAEALEVRDGPLEEPELWGVLCQAAEAVQDLFLQRSVEGTFSEIIQMLPITCDSLLLCCDGRICPCPSSSTDPPSKEFFPPEYGRSRNLTEEEVEKMFVFSLGVTLLTAASFRLPSDQRLNISHELDVLLKSMCSTEPFLRATLFHVLRTCNNSRQHRLNGAIPSGHFVMKLYQLVLGSSDDVSCWGKESDQGDWSSPSEIRQQTTSSGSRSKVRSRSGSHNVSRQSYHHNQKLRERPRTIGRDELSDITRNSVQSDHFSSLSHRLLSPKSYGANHEISRTSNDVIVHHVVQDSRPNQVLTMSASKPEKHLHDDDAMKSQDWWMPVFDLHADGMKSFSGSTGNLAGTETLEQAYHRLNRRRRKLDILRREAHFDGRDVSDVLSLGSDVDAHPNEQRDVSHSTTDISNDHRHHRHLNTSETDRHRTSKKHQSPKHGHRNLSALESEREKLQRKELEIEQWRKFQMQRLDPLIVDTASVWNDISTKSQLPPSGGRSQTSTTLSERSPSIRHPRRVNKKTGPSSNTVFHQTSDHATTSMFDDVHRRRTRSPVGTSEFETSPSVNSPIHDELSTNHESTPDSPRTLDLNSHTRSTSPLARNLGNAVRVRDIETYYDTFYETLPGSSLEGTHPQTLSRGNSSQSLNLAPVQAVEFDVTPPVNVYLGTFERRSSLSVTDPKKLINAGMEESGTKDGRLLEVDVHGNRRKEASGPSVDDSGTKSSTLADTSTTLSESLGAMVQEKFNQSPESQVQTKTEAPVKAPRKKSLTPVVALESYGLSIHETVSVSPKNSDGTHTESGVPIKAPRRKSLTPVGAINSYNVSNTEAFSVSPSESSAIGDESEAPRKAPPRKKSIVNDTKADDADLPDDGTIVPPDAFRSPAVDPGRRKSMDSCDQECQTDVAHLTKTEDAVSDVNTPKSRETVTPEMTRPNSPKYTADYLISTTDATVFSLDPVVAKPASKQDALNVVESTVTSTNSIEVFTDSPIKMHENVEQYVVTKPDNTEVLTDTPAKMHAEQYVVTKPDNTEVLTDTPAKMHAEQYVVTKPDNTEVLTDSPAKMHANENVEQYVVTKPDNTEVLTNTPAKMHAEQYVVTKPDNTEVLTDTPAKMHAEQYVVTKPDNTEVLTDTPAKMHANENVEQYVVTKPDNTEVLTNTPAKMHAEQYVVTKPDNTEVLTDTPAKMHTNENVEQYVVTKPDNTEVLTDSRAKMHAEQYVVTKPDNTEVLTDTPAKMHAEQYVVTKPDNTEVLTDSPAKMHVNENVEQYVVTKPDSKEMFTDSPAKTHPSENVEPYVATKPDSNEIFTASPRKVHASDNIKDYVVTTPGSTEVLTDPPAVVHTSQNVEQYVVTKPNNTNILTDSSRTSSEDRNVEQYVVMTPGNTEVLTESLTSRNDEPHEPETSEVPAKTNLTQDVGQFSVTHTDRVEVFSDSIKTSDDSEPEAPAKSSAPENVLPTFISIPNSTHAFADVVVGNEMAETEVKPPAKAPRKSLKTPVQELVLPPGDDARSTPPTAGELEKVPPPKAPRKLIRTGANDGPSPTMPPPTPTPGDASGSESERGRGAAATGVLLPSAPDLRNRSVEDGEDSEVAALTARRNDETDSENFRQVSHRSFVETGVDPGRSSRGTVEEGRGPISVAPGEGGKGKSQRMEEQETLDPAVPKTWKKQDRIVGNKAPRHCYGPEFAHFNSQMATLIVPDAGGVPQVDLRHVLVVLLDGVHLDLICSVNSIGRHLYDCVASYLTLAEQVFFGLVYVQGEEYYFLTPETKIHKVAPVDWKKKNKPGQRQTGTFVLYFRAKFYISDFEQLRHKQTRHLFYLQLRHDLLDESLHCSDELALALGSLAVQAEYGDWYERSAELDVDHYLGASVVRRLGKTDAKEALLQQHSRYNGMPDAKAEWLLMQKCVQLPEYGLHFHKIFRSKNTPNESLLVGINLHGVILAEDRGNGRVFTRQHPWHTIYKISFNKHRFSIATKTATASVSEALVKFNYYTSTYKKGQYLVWLSTEHHRFRLLSRLPRTSRSHSNPSSLLEDEYLMIDGASSSAVGSNVSLNLDEAYDNEANQNISGRRNENNNNNEQSYVDVDPEDDAQSVPGRLQRRDSQRERPVSFPIGPNPAAPHRNHSQRYSLPNEPSGEFQDDPVIDAEEILDRRSNASSALDLEDVLPHELLCLPQPQRESQAPGETDSEELDRVNDQTYESGPSNTESRDHPQKRSDDDVLGVGRNLRPGDRYDVILRKKESSFGINIAGGTNTNMKMGGVYVKSLTPDGAAERDGRIQVGDRILQVNGISLVGASHRQAVEILRSSPPTSALQLERCDPPSVTPSIISSWSSLERSELEVESMDTGIELKSKSRGNGKKMLRAKQVSVSESGINSEEISAFNGETDIEPPESHADSKNLTRESYADFKDLTRLPNIRDSSVLRRQETVNRSDETDVSRTLLNSNEVGVFASRAELRERMFPRRPTLDRRHTVSSPSSQPVSATSSFQLPTSPHTTSEYNGDLDSSVVGTSIGRTSRQVPYNSDVPKSEFEDVSSGESGDDDEEYERLVNEHSGSAQVDESAVGDYETMSEYFPHEDDRLVDTAIPEEFDSEFVELNRSCYMGPAGPLLEKKIYLHLFGLLQGLKFVPPSSGSAILKDLPQLLSSDWFDELPLISLAAGNQLYTGSNLKIMIQDLEDRLMRGQPPVEYKSLKQIRMTDNCLEGLNPDNKHKNRYRNVLPYDKTRVQLSGPDDYINASHITFGVGQTQRQYIAAQGPLPETVAHFWRMIWEQDVDVVVMLTQEVEGGKVKCDRYWPELSDGPGFLGTLFRVTQLEIHHLPNCVVRFFQMDDLTSGAARLITHLNFTTWPDHNTPENGIAVLRFIRLMHGVHHGSGPILVHCSAGVGRTGALLTIDICLALIEHNLKFDIESVARELRQQRHGMIQTQDQYIFCYSAILSALKSLRSTT